MSERIAKFLARSGVCSRREAENYITQGRITVNGETVETPAFLVNGERLKRKIARACGCTTNRQGLLPHIKMKKSATRYLPIYRQACRVLSLLAGWI